MDAKKVKAGIRAIQDHRKAVEAVKRQSVSRLSKPQQEKQPPMIKALKRIAREGLKIELTPREKAQFYKARAAELAAREAKFTI